MKHHYLLVTVEKFGECETSSDCLVCLNAPITSTFLHEHARNERLVDESAFDEMGGGGYWFEGNFTLLPRVYELTDAQFKILSDARDIKASLRHYMCNQLQSGMPK